MYKIVEVATEADVRAFLDLPIRLYKDCEYWVRPMDSDIEGVFDKKKNALFETGEASRWLLYDEKGECVGRVAAFVNGKSCYGEEHSVGQMGFFECINDKEAAFALFDRCREWLEERKMEVMEGPVNFGERMSWWGLLTEGFDQYPAYSMPYTFEYYIPLFEAYGFKNHYNQNRYRIRLIEENLSPIVIWKADRILRNEDYYVATLREIGAKRAIDSILEIYNKAWSVEIHGVDNVGREEIVGLYKSLKPILDKDLIYFAFHKDEPIGFYLMFPELNQVIRRYRKGMNLWSILKMLASVRLGKIETALGVLFGVVPEFQNKGIEAAMIKRFFENIVVQESPYKYLELNWIGDFNPPMIHLMDYIGGKLASVHVTYRKPLREGITLERAIDRINRLHHSI